MPNRPPLPSDAQESAAVSGCEPLRVVLIAGESSGDLHGAAFVRALRRLSPGVEVSGIGGENLRAAGMQILYDTAHVATMGFVETFGVLGRLVRVYRDVKRWMDEQRPHLVVLIDYPEFNLRVARQARRRGIKVFYFIGPQVWAWRKGRVKKIARRVDKMALVFPFEPELYNAQRPPGEEPLAEFVGHPLLDVVRRTKSREETLADHGLHANVPTLALLPGSRVKEIRALIEPLCSAAEQLRDEGWQALLALAPNLEPGVLTEARNGRPVPVPVIRGDTYNVIGAADAAVVASGTATLETALLGCPMVIVYRVSPVTYWLARQLVKVEWIGMPNIILQRSVFPELIQHAVTSERIVAHVKEVAARKAEMKAAAVLIREALGQPGAAERAARLALKLAPSR